jgi:hypothetical protein
MVTSRPAVEMLAASDQPKETVMLRNSGLLAMALGLALLASINPGAAISHASTTMKPIEVQPGQLPLPPRGLKVLPTHCEVTNCIRPSDNRGRG